MGLGLLLIPSLGGYWFLRRANFTRFEIFRLSGYHLLFQSALAGIILASFAHLIALRIDAIVPQIRSFWYAYIPVDYVDTAILSILLAVVIPPVINRFHSEEKAVKRAAEKYGDHIELMIARAFERGKLIELSLKNRKSYIGIVLRSVITERGRSDVTLLPIASGYRSEDTLDLYITTNYAKIIDEMIGENKEGIPDILRDFYVVAGAVAAACGLILAADDREGVEDVGGVLAGQAVEVEIEGVEAGAQVAALLRVPGERRAAAEKVSPAAIRRDTSSCTRRRRP